MFRKKTYPNKHKNHFRQSPLPDANLPRFSPKKILYLQQFSQHREWNSLLALIV
jgi:hypothetical protein